MITQSTIKKGKENTVADKSLQLSDISNREEYLTAVEEYGSSADYIQSLDK